MRVEDSLVPILLQSIPEQELVCVALDELGPAWDFVIFDFELRRDRNRFRTGLGIGFNSTCLHSF